MGIKQGCGAGSGLDPDSIGSVDPESGSGSRRAKMTHKSREKFVKVHVLKCWMASFADPYDFGTDPDPRICTSDQTALDPALFVNDLKEANK
jgi:hypothetical protein